MSEIRLKYLFSKRIGGAWGDEPQDDNAIICIRAADFNTDLLTHSTENLTRRSFDKNEIENKKLIAGDLIIEKSGGGENQPVGRVVKFNLNETALCSNFLELLRPDNSIADSEYLAYLFYALWKNRVVTKAIKQTTGIQNLDISDYFDNKIQLPDLETQAEIVSYLNKQVAHIDKLIDQKGKQIKILEEKRQALITQAVTKGINPKVKLKDSGIDWLGEIPEHWKVKKLKYIVEKIDEIVESANFIIAVENIESFTGNLVNMEQDNFYEGAQYKFKTNDIVFNKLRPYLSKVFLAKSEGACVGELLILRPNENVIPEYLFYLMLSSKFIDEVNSSTVGAKMPRANWDDYIKHIKIPIPQVEEQLHIVNSIKKNLEFMSKTAEATRISLKLLSEKKASLIFNCVTGGKKLN